MNHSEVADKLNGTTDPLVALEIASDWTRKEIDKAVTECRELASGADSDAADAVDRLAILELCTPEFTKACKKHWDAVSALLAA